MEDPISCAVSALPAPPHNSYEFPTPCPSRCIHLQPKTEPRNLCKFVSEKHTCSASSKIHLFFFLNNWNTGFFFSPFKWKCFWHGASLKHSYSLRTLKPRSCIRVTWGPQTPGELEAKNFPAEQCPQDLQVLSSHDLCGEGLEYK